jgi:hypothetical protein
MILKEISKGDNHYLNKQYPYLMEGGAVRHNIERDTPRLGLYINVSCQVWLHFVKQFQRRRFF